MHGRYEPMMVGSRCKLKWYVRMSCRDWAGKQSGATQTVNEPCRGWDMSHTVSHLFDNAEKFTWATVNRSPRNGVKFGVEHNPQIPPEAPRMCCCSILGATQCASVTGFFQVGTQLHSHCCTGIEDSRHYSPAAAATAAAPNLSRPSHHSFIRSSSSHARCCSWARSWTPPATAPAPSASMTRWAPPSAAPSTHCASSPSAPHSYCRCPR